VRWLEGLLHRLKHEGPARVLQHLAWLAARYPSPTIQEKLAYLQKREAHMQYPIYQEAGWPIGSGSVGEWGKRQQTGRRSTPQRSRHALGAAERQPHADAAQCGVQSRVEADLGDLGGASTSGAHKAAASNEPATARQCRVVPRRVGRTGLSAVSSPWCCFPSTDGYCQQREATNSSSWFWLFLAQTVSQASFFDPCCYRRGLCKKMKHTPCATLNTANACPKAQ
jgi:hypothetical protein